MLGGNKMSKGRRYDSEPKLNLKKVFGQPKVDL